MFASFEPCAPSPPHCRRLGISARHSRVQHCFESPSSAAQRTSRIRRPDLRQRLEGHRKLDDIVSNNCNRRSRPRTAAILDLAEPRLAESRSLRSIRGSSR